MRKSTIWILLMLAFSTLNAVIVSRQLSRDHVTMFPLVLNAACIFLPLIPAWTWLQLRLKYGR